MPSGVDVILRRALSPHPQERYPNLGSFVNSLKEIRPLTSDEIVRRSQQLLELGAVQEEPVHPPAAAEAAKAPSESAVKIHPEAEPGEAVSRLNLRRLKLEKAGEIGSRPGKRLSEGRKS
jgi:hypothetical protein